MFEVLVLVVPRLDNVSLLILLVELISVAVDVDVNLIVLNVVDGLIGIRRGVIENISKTITFLEGIFNPISTNDSKKSLTGVPLSKLNFKLIVIIMFLT